MFVIKYLQLKSSFGWSLSNLVALLRHQLFVYRDLDAWLNDPFQPALEGVHDDPQLTMALARKATIRSWGLRNYFVLLKGTPCRRPAKVRDENLTFDFNGLT